MKAKEKKVNNFPSTFLFIFYFLT